MLQHRVESLAKVIFHRVREIIDADQEENWAQNTALGSSSLDRERREDSIESQTLASRVEEVMCGVALGCHRQKLWRARQDARLYLKLEIFPERWPRSHV